MYCSSPQGRGTNGMGYTGTSPRLRPRAKKMTGITTTIGSSRACPIRAELTTRRPSPGLQQNNPCHRWSSTCASVTLSTACSPSPPRNFMTADGGNANFLGGSTARARCSRRVWQWCVALPSPSTLRFALGGVLLLADFPMPHPDRCQKDQGQSVQRALAIRLTSAGLRHPSKGYDTYAPYRGR